MRVREYSARYLEPVSIGLMVVGVVSLCQPWIGVLHAYSVGIMLLGLVGFNIAAHIAPPEPKRDEQHG